MAEWDIMQADIFDWCKEEHEPYHAMLCDPPWHLRGGFMGKYWDRDGADAVSFQPKTWAALSEHLLPGAFIMVFAASRGWHRLACAIEDAGFVIQPSIFVEGVGVVDVTPMVLWVQSQSFPKASRLDKKLDERAGMQQEVIGSRVTGGICRPTTTGQNPCPSNPNHSSGQIEIPVTQPATDLAKSWADHRYGGQILRDCATPIVVAQKPWTSPRLDCIVETGAGSLWVEGARVATGTQTPGGGGFKGGAGNRHPGWDRPSHQEGYAMGPHNKGRWPPNYVPTHFAMTLEDGTVWGCQPITEIVPCPDCSGDGGNGRGCETCGGTGVVEVEAVERVKGTLPKSIESSGFKCGDDGKTMGKGWNGADWVGCTDKDGREPIKRFACARHCPDCGAWWLSEEATRCPECGGEGEWACSVRRLGVDSGKLTSNNGKGPHSIQATKNRNAKRVAFGDYGASKDQVYGDKGTAARFYPNPHYWAETAEALALGQVRKYQAKPSPREKSSGLERFVWRKQKSGHTRVWSDAAIDQFWHWQEESKGLPGKGFDEWLEACGESKRKIHRIPYTWGNIHPTVKSIELNRWLATLLLPPDIYAPRRLLIPFCGTFSEGVGALLAGWEHITAIDSDEQTCWQAEARARFWTGWNERTGETEPKQILKAYRKAQKKAKATKAKRELQQLALGAI